MYIHTHTSMYLIRWTHAYVCIYVYIYIYTQEFYRTNYNSDQSNGNPYSKSILTSCHVFHHSDISTCYAMFFIDPNNRQPLDHDPRPGRSPFSTVSAPLSPFPWRAGCSWWPCTLDIDPAFNGCERNRMMMNDGQMDMYIYLYIYTYVTGRFSSNNNGD